MSIDFPCPQCGKLLRTPDDAVGKQARCPSCQAVAAVPNPSGPNPSGPNPSGPDPDHSPFNDSPFNPAAVGPSSSIPPSLAADHEPNPYASPYAGLGPSATPIEGPLSGRPVKIAFQTIFRDTWTIFTNNLGQCVLFALAFLGITFGFSMVMQVVILAMSQLGQAAAIGANAVMQILNLFVGGYTYTVAVRFTCNVTRGSISPLSDAFNSFRFVIRLALFNVLIMLSYLPIVILVVAPFGVAMAIGEEPFSPISIGTAIAIGVLGVILLVWLVWMQMFLGPFFIVDRDLGVLESVKASATYMEGNKGICFLMLLVTGLVGGVVSLCTCYLGALFAMPYMLILLGLIYLTATGQPYWLANPRHNPPPVTPDPNAVTPTQ